MLSRLENSVIKPVETTSFLTMQRGHLENRPGLRRPLLVHTQDVATAHCSLRLPPSKTTSHCFCRCPSKGTLNEYT